MTLYELTDNYRQILAMMEEEDIDQEAIKDTLEALSGDITEKAESYAIIMKELEAEAEKLKKEEDRLKRRRTALENHKEAMKDSLRNAMEMTGKKKFKTEHFSFSIQKNGGSLPVIIENADALPERFKIFSWKADTEQLRNYLEMMGGNVGYAKLGERGESLRIR